MPDVFFAKGGPSQAHFLWLERDKLVFFYATGVGTVSSSKCSSKSEATEHSQSHSLPDSIL